MSCSECEYEESQEIRRTVDGVIEHSLRTLKKEFLEEAFINLSETVKKYCDTKLLEKYSFDDKVDLLDDFLKQRLKTLLDDGSFKDMTAEVYVREIDMIRDDLKETLSKDYKDALIKITFLQQRLIDIERKLTTSPTKTTTDDKRKIKFR